MMPDITIRREQPGDYQGIDRINRMAFETDAEARLVGMLRDAGALVLSLVACGGEELLGHIAASPVTINGRPGGVGLGPMAVLPGHQRQGIGGRLMRECLKELRSDNHDLVVLLGHPEYYPRFGFVPAGSFGITCSYACPPEAFMAQSLGGNALSLWAGVVRYHPAFDSV